MIPFIVDRGVLHCLPRPCHYSCPFLVARLYTAWKANGSLRSFDGYYGQERKSVYKKKLFLLATTDLKEHPEQSLVWQKLFPLFLIFPLLLSHNVVSLSGYLFPLSLFSLVSLVVHVSKELCLNIYSHRVQPLAPASGKTDTPHWVLLIVVSASGISPKRSRVVCNL